MVVGCVGTSYVLRLELPVQRRLCPIFVRDVGSPDIHECFRGLTSSQRTPRIWGVTVYEAVNGHEFQFHKVEPMFDEWVAHGQPTARFWDC